MLTRLAWRSRSRPTSSSLIPDPALKGSRGASKPGTRRLIWTTRAVMAGLVQVEPGHDNFRLSWFPRARNRTSFPEKPCAFAGMMNEILGFISGQLLSVLLE